MNEEVCTNTTTQVCNDVQELQCSTPLGQTPVTNLGTPFAADTVVGPRLGTPFSADTLGGKPFGSKTASAGFGRPLAGGLSNAFQPRALAGTAKSFGAGIMISFFFPFYTKQVALFLSLKLIRT